MVTRDLPRFYPVISVTVFHIFVRNLLHSGIGRPRVCSKRSKLDRPIPLKGLTPKGQLSLQGTFRVWTDVKELWTKADEGRRECKMQNFISFLMVLIILKISNFFPGKISHLSKMSLQGTIVPGRLRSELCPWGVKWTLMNPPWSRFEFRRLCFYRLSLRRCRIQC